MRKTEPIPRIFISYSTRMSHDPQITKDLILLIKTVISKMNWIHEDPMETKNIDSIDTKVKESILSSDAIIADITTQNPNVMLEVGYASMLGYPIILVLNKDAYTEEFYKDHFKYFKISSDNPLPADLPNIEFIEYSKSTIDSDQGRQSFENNLLNLLKNLGNSDLSLGHRFVRDSYKAIMGRKKFILKDYRDRDHPNVHFLGSILNQFEKIVKQGGSEEFYVDSYYYANSLTDIRSYKSEILAVADIQPDGDEILEDFWYENPNPEHTQVKERIFLVHWKQILNREKCQKLAINLKEQSKKYPVRVGYYPRNYIKDIFGENGHTRNMLLIEPDVVGGYETDKKNKKKIYLTVKKSPQLYLEAKSVYNRLLKETIEYNHEWNWKDFRSEWIEFEKIGKWDDDWSVQKNKGYFNKYDMHIRCWVPNYEDLIRKTFDQVHKEFINILKIMPSSNRIKILEIGFGTGELSSLIVNMISNFNQPFVDARVQTPIDQFVGIDKESRMVEIANKDIGHKNNDVMFIEGTAWDDLPYEVERLEFDIICGSLVLHDIVSSSNTDQSISEFFEYGNKLLKDKGCLIFCDVIMGEGIDVTDNNNNWYRWMNDIGLSSDDIKNFFDKNRDMVDSLTVSLLKKHSKAHGFSDLRIKKLPRIYGEKNPFHIIVAKKGY